MSRKAANLGIGVLIAVAVLAVVVTLAGREDDPPAGNYGEGGPDYEKLLAGSPPPLAALHEQGNDLLPGGVDAYEERIGALEGYPVVVNVWASWCGPCRLEFPHFQALSAEMGKRVAFLGVNSYDGEEPAATFLEQYPVPYPSFSDPDRLIWDELDVLSLPATAFYDRRGELVHLKHGPYTGKADLRADVERYALE